MATYTTKADVQRILSASGRKNVRFSAEAVSEISVYDDEMDINEDISVSVGDINATSSFQGHQVYELRFTNATTYDVYRVGNESDYRAILLDSGNLISTLYTSSDGNLTIEANTFGGTISAGDSIRIKLTANLSDDNVDLFIEDTEFIIDTLLQEMYIGTIEDGNDTIYLSGSVPKPVKVATTYLTAFYIYTDIFADVGRDEEEHYGYLKRWEKRAERVLKSFAQVQGRSFPSVIAFPKFAGYVGHENIGPGGSFAEDNSDDIQRDTEADDIFEAY